METLGQRLRRERIRQGMTLQAIAERMLVVPMYVSDIERGKRIPLKEEALANIANAYGLRFEEVLDLALSSRDAVPLNTAGQNDARKQVAVKLARAWTDMTDETIEGLEKFLEGR